MVLEQASRMIHGSGYAHGLYPAQWVALRYFGEADAPARTASGLARFQDMSIAPVARTIRTLVEKGLLERQSNPKSRRADLVAVTAAGRTVLQRDPRQPIEALLSGLPESNREALAEALEMLVRELPRVSPYITRARLSAAADPK